MRTLAASKDPTLIVERLERLRPDDFHRWGRMNAHQMLRHLVDSMRIPLGEIRVSEAKVPHLQHIVLKWVALYIPLKWLRNFPTRPEIDQCMLNLPLPDFEANGRSRSRLSMACPGQTWKGSAIRILGQLRTRNGSDGVGSMPTIIYASSGAEKSRIRVSEPGGQAPR